MKNTKWLLLVLAAVTLSWPVCAQSQDPHAKEKWGNGKLISAAIERAAVKAVREHKDSHCPQCGAQYTIDEKYHGVKHECAAQENSVNRCARCGQKVFPGQHCAAVDYTELCSDSAPVQEKQEEINEGLLHQAEALLQHDRDIHNGYSKHDLNYYYNLLKNEQKTARICARCGQDLLPGQHCAAADYTNLCSDSAPVQEKQGAKAAASHCKKCGAQYTIDEKYHGVKHNCPAE